MSEFLLFMAGMSALLMFWFGLTGSMDMMSPREQAKTKQEEFDRFLDAVLSGGAGWQAQCFRQNWRKKHQARKLIYRAGGFLALTILLCALRIWAEISKS